MPRAALFMSCEINGYQILVQEQILKGLPKLSRHAAINGEINRVTDNNEEISEQNSGVKQFVFDDPYLYGVLQDVQQGGDGERDLH